MPIGLKYSASGIGSFEGPNLLTTPTYYVADPAPTRNLGSDLTTDETLNAMNITVVTPTVVAFDAWFLFNVPVPCASFSPSFSMISGPATIDDMGYAQTTLTEGDYGESEEIVMQAEWRGWTYTLTTSVSVGGPTYIEFDSWLDATPPWAETTVFNIASSAISGLTAQSPNQVAASGDPPILGTGSDYTQSLLVTFEASEGGSGEWNANNAVIAAGVDVTCINIGVWAPWLPMAGIFGGSGVLIASDTIAYVNHFPPDFLRFIGSNSTVYGASFSPSVNTVAIIPGISGFSVSKINWNEGIDPVALGYVKPAAMLYTAGELTDYFPDIGTHYGPHVSNVPYGSQIVSMPGWRVDQAACTVALGITNFLGGIVMPAPGDFADWSAIKVSEDSGGLIFIVMPHPSTGDPRLVAIGLLSGGPVAAYQSDIAAALTTIGSAYTLDLIDLDMAGYQTA